MTTHLSPEVNLRSDLETRLLPYQVTPAFELAEAVKLNRATVDSSDTGTGKTFVALAMVKYLNLIPTIVCPKISIPAWWRACRHFGVQPYSITNYEKLKGNKYPSVQWSVPKGCRKKRPAWFLPSGSILLFDEAHRCSGMKSLNAELLIAAVKQGIKAHAISATLADNPLKMRAVGFALGLHHEHDFWTWCKKQGCRQGRWGGMEYVGGPARMKALHSQIFPSKGVRVTRQSLGDQFPETLIDAQSYGVDGNESVAIQCQLNLLAEKRALDAVRAKEAAMERIAKWNAKHPEAPIDEEDEPGDPEAVTLILRARQEVELLKIPIFVELAENALEEGNSVAIFVNFDATRELLAEHFEKRTPSQIYGQQPPLVREGNIQAFQQNKTRLIILNTQAGGISIDLHDVHGEHPRRSLISPTYSAVELIQALGRVCRAGGKTKSYQTIVFAAGTVEEDTCKQVQKKLNNLAALNDGDLRAGLQITVPE